MPKKPTSEWWNKTTKQIRKDNPSYSKKQVDETAGHIWHHNMSPSQKKKETMKAEGSLKTKAEHPVSLDHKYPLRLGRDVVNILSLYHQGQADPLYQVVSRLTYNDQTRASEIELKAVLEELNNAISDFESELSGDEPDEHGAIDLSKLREAKEKVQHILRTKRAHKITAAELKNLFAKDYESWIQMEARLLSQNNFGTWGSLEEANQKIDEAIKELTQTLTKGIEPEVKRIVEEERKNILEEMEASITMGQDSGQDAVEAPPGGDMMPPADEGELGDLETKVDNLMPPGASKKAQMASGIEDKRTEEEKKKEHDKWELAKKGPQQKIEDLSDDDLDAFEKSLDEKLAALDAKTAKGLTQTDMTRVKKDKENTKKEKQKKEDKKTTDMFHSAQKKTRDEHLDELYNDFLKDDATDKVDFEKEDKDVTDAELDKLWVEMGFDDDKVEDYEDDDETWKHEGEEEYDRFAGKK